jgi:hypothetical protein
MAVGGNMPCNESVCLYWNKDGPGCALGNKEFCPELDKKCPHHTFKENRKFDKGKLRYNLLPMDALDEVVKRFTHGAEKYEVDSWKLVDNAVERYSAALMRHYSAWRQGEGYDPDCPELTHIGAVAWNALALVWFELHKEDKNNEQS